MQSHAPRRVTWSTATSRTTTAGASNWTESEADDEPIRLNYLNEKLRLDEAEAARNSPILHLPSRASPLLVTVGLGELPELIRQSEEYARAWQQHDLPGEYLPLARHDHFSILEELARPEGKILGALGGLARRRS
jgi:arylformamidase